MTLRVGKWISIVAIAVIAAACGSSGSSNKSDDKPASATTVAPAANTKEAFVEKANALCKKANDELTAKAPSDSSTDAQKVKFYEESVIPLEHDAIAGIRKLTPPAADAAQVTAILDAADAGFSKIGQDLKTNPEAVLKGEGENPLEQANTLALAYGLTECGSA